MAKVIPIVAKSEKNKGGEERLPVIDLDEFEEDRRDSNWQQFLSEARKERARLRLDNRIK
jgi:hypothetical protein